MALKRAVSTQIFHYSTEQGAPRSPICTMFKFQKRGATLSGELHLLSGTCQERQWTPPPYHIPCMSVNLKGDNTLRAQVVSSQWTLCREGPGYNFTCQECWHWPKVFVLFANWLITNFQTCKFASNIYVLVLIMVYIMVVVCCSVTHLCPTLCDLMDCSTPHFPVLHYLPEFAQTRVHWISDAIQPSHPLSPQMQPSLCPDVRAASFLDKLPGKIPASTEQNTFLKSTASTESHKSHQHLVVLFPFFSLESL